MRWADLRRASSSVVGDAGMFVSEQNKPTMKQKIVLFIGIQSDNFVGGKTRREVSYLRQLPRITPGPIEHAVGLRVIHELLGLRIPFEFAAQLEHEVRQVADSA